MSLFSSFSKNCLVPINWLFYSSISRPLSTWDSQPPFPPSSTVTLARSLLPSISLFTCCVARSVSHAASLFVCFQAIPPAPMKHIKILKGWPLRDAPSELVQLWYKSFPSYFSTHNISLSLSLFFSLSGSLSLSLNDSMSHSFSLIIRCLTHSPSFSYHARQSLFVSEILFDPQYLPR